MPAPDNSSLFPYTTLFRSRGERTMRTFSRPVNLARFDRLEWMTTEKPVWFIVYHLFDVQHYKLLTPAMLDRKSTRLNSSHEWISYAVFCLKKKKKNSVCIS